MGAALKMDALFVTVPLSLMSLVNQKDLCLGYRDAFVNRYRLVLRRLANR
jgi:hypothetical protein